MTTYATNNPIGSMDPKDLFDNSQNLDFALNDITQAIWKDRFGRNRKTLWGAEQEFNSQLLYQSQTFNAQLLAQKQKLDAQILSQEQRFDIFIQSSGYEVIGDYTSGPLTIDEFNKLIRYQNELWRLNASTTPPFTTTGNDATSWANDSTHFVSVGDAALRQQITDPNGATNYPELQVARWRDDGDARGWGAKGDGVRDDTGEMQLAVDHCVRTGKALYISDGCTFLVSSLDITGLSAIYGRGAGSKIKHKPGIAQNTHMLRAQDSSHLVVKSLWLDGSAVSSSGESHLLDILSYSDVLVEDVTFYRSSSASLKVKGNATAPSRNIFVTKCRSIESAYTGGFNRNGLDFFVCHNVVVSECYVKGNGADPNNVGIIFMGCQYFSCDNNILEDNASEQIQVIGTEHQTELPPYNQFRGMYGSITNCICRHPSGLSKTSNISIGENANDIVVSGCDLSGSLGSAIAIFKWSKNIIIANNKMHDSNSAGVTINDKSYGEVTIADNLIRDINGASGIVVLADTIAMTGVIIRNNRIYNINAGGAASVSRPFELRGDLIGGITIDGNICGGSYTHAVDTTNATIGNRSIIISNNDFRGYTVAGWRNPLREAYCWGNLEPNSNAPSFYRASTTFNLASGANINKAWNEAQSKGSLSYKIAFDAGSTGAVYTAEGMVIGTVTGEKKVNIREAGLGAVSGTLFSFAMPS